MQSTRSISDGSIRANQCDRNSRHNTWRLAIFWSQTYTRLYLMGGWNIQFHNTIFLSRRIPGSTGVLVSTDMDSKAVQTQFGRGKAIDRYRSQGYAHPLWWKISGIRRPYRLQRHASSLIATRKCMKYAYYKSAYPILKSWTPQSLPSKSMPAFDMTQMSFRSRYSSL